jgi:cytochrome P450
MPYLEAVIKETMRIAPLPSMELRKMGETTVIDGKQIPRNYMVLNSIRRTHEEDPATFMEDGSHMDLFKGFKPERWLPNDQKDNDGLRVPEEYIPWGYGVRRCVGERLAMAEMKIFLATLARHIDFELVQGDKSRAFNFQKKSFMTKPEDGAAIRH